MRRDRAPEGEPELFDLPLEVESASNPEIESADPVLENPLEEPDPPGVPEALELFPEEEQDAAIPPEPRSTLETHPMAALDPRQPAPVSTRFLAGLLDLGLVVALAAVMLVGLLLMRVELGAELWPAFLLFELAFSFVYCVVPLGFWGRTPAMKRFGLLARNQDGQLLSFGQSTLRWIGGLLTLVGLGLPLLLVPLTGTSLSDLLSASMTYQVTR